VKIQFTTGAGHVTVDLVGIGTSGSTLTSVTALNAAGYHLTFA
jgi:hypothetical protein